ncbi:NAD(+)/NADH kinase [Helicobacter canis]|uniref:NAD kinase n=1 Tax=Helicobacter canis TaxID=29419 RepID=A0A5M9QND4_9HELI|nr:NAD(+)/NADH kinase [Helicobacter canis]KAA8709820.1 NAD(+)/NADH kinase [Helicobacter canis]
MRESQKVAAKPKPQKIDKIALIVRPESPELADACKEVIAIFERFGVEVCVLESSVASLGLDPRLACKESELGERAQALVSLGGDGTLISAVRKSLGLGLPVLGINMGRLGFLTAIKPSELEEFVPLLKSGGYVIDSHHLLQGLLVDSVLGEQFDKIENFVKGTDRESANLPQNFQNLQSPTATPRILEEENQAENETQTELESSFKKADSSNAQIFNESAKDSRICDEKSLLCERTQGRILGVCNRRARDAIKDLSRKAESTSEQPAQETPSPFYVLNEILITKKDISGMTKIYATINNEHFHTYRADGLIIATPTGSSAYNISAGGSLVHPQCRVILLTPICAHSLTQRPIIISDNFCLQFSVEEDSVIMLDGQERIDFRKGDTLFVQGSFPIQLIQHPKRSYFAVLEEKFGLGGKQV